MIGKAIWAGLALAVLGPAVGELVGTGAPGHGRSGAAWYQGVGALEAQEPDDIGLPTGTAVHPVTLEDLDGHPVDLAPYMGHRPALFEFWATWCENCTALEPRMRAAFERHGRQVDFVVVAVGVNQSKASVTRHVHLHPLPAERVLWDTNGNAVRAFDTPATSYVVILDRQGKVAYTGLGPGQDLEAALARVIR